MTYYHGKPPDEFQNRGRGDYVKTQEGYFKLRRSITEWINEPRGKSQSANIKFKVEYLFHSNSKRMIPQLKWHVLRNIKKGEEVLANYK